MTVGSGTMIINVDDYATLSVPDINGHFEDKGRTINIKSLKNNECRMFITTLLYPLKLTS